MSLNITVTCVVQGHGPEVAGLSILKIKQENEYSNIVSIFYDQRLFRRLVENTLSLDLHNAGKYVPLVMLQLPP